MKIKAMIFDMDGVITSSSNEHFSAWRALAAGLGFDLPDELEVLTKGVSRMDSLEIVLRHGSMEDKFTLEEKEAMAARKNRMYVDMISEFTPANLMPGVLELLDECVREDIRIALASASRNGPLLIDRLGIGRYFDYVVNPADIALGKPAPDVFLKASSELGIGPISCVGVEDAVAGIASIKAAGMTAVGIGSPDELSQADIVYEDCSKVDLHALNKLML